MPPHSSLTARASRARPRSVATAILAVAGLLCNRPVYGGDAPRAEEPSSRQEIAQAMQELERKFGKDAVALEAQLLGQAVRSGSILAAGISVPGIRERDGARFLGFDLDTGIVFNDRSTTAEQRASEVWTQIVAPSLRRFGVLTLPADGVGLRISYHHRPYADLSELRTHLREDAGPTETAEFYIRIADAAELAAGHITGQQLVDRSIVLIDGAMQRLAVLEPTPAPTANVDL